jgi:hypothetical protein
MMKSSIIFLMFNYLAKCSIIIKRWQSFSKSDKTMWEIKCKICIIKMLKSAE